MTVDLEPVPTSEEKTLAVLMHLSVIFAPIVLPLIVWLVKKDESRYLDGVGREVLNFHLTLTIAGVAMVVVAVVGSLVTLGVGWILLGPLMGLGVAAVSVAGLVCGILATVAASDGRRYRYPVSLRLV